MNRILSTIFIINFSFFNFSLAKGDFNSKIKCYKQAKKELKKLKSKNKFSKVYHPKNTILRSQTKVFGKWIQISIENKELKNLWVFEGENRKKYEFKSECNLSLLYNNNLKTRKYSQKTFNDENLKLLINKGRGIIYIINPSFRYSIKYLPEVIDFAKENKIELTVLFSSRSKLGKNLSRSLASDFLTKDSFKINRSLELKIRQLELHSPSYAFYKNGRLLNDNLIGVHTTSGLKNFYKKNMR